MMNKNDFDKSIQGLRGSSMFYMSLGSKELFHSNFLHWLSIIDKKYFLKVIHELAGEHNDFWWEDPKYKVDVRREDKSFDLSIWVLDNDRDKDDEKEEKWIPVLILENKMKSLPYREQLEKYVDKVFDIWRKGDSKVDVKSEIEDLKKNPNKDWKTKYNITFILLSLLKPINKGELENPINKSISYGRKPNLKTTHPIAFSWLCKSYDDLSKAIQYNYKYLNNSQQTISPSAIIADYKVFIDNMYKIANEDWKIELEHDYIERVCPKDLGKGDDEYYKIVELEKLRIADIRDKIINDQLLNLLIEQLQKKNISCKRYQSGDYNDNSSTGKGTFLCNTNFFHNVGLFEIIFLIEKKQKGNKNAEPFFITIQIQGKDYTHGIAGKNIVEKKGTVNDLGQFWTNNGPWQNKLNFFFDFRDENLKNTSPSNSHFPQISGLKLKENGKNYKYDTSFVYQSSIIQPKMTVDDVLKCVVAEVESIQEKLWPIK